MQHVRAIAERPRPSGSSEHERVRQYLLRELTSLGLDPQVQEATGVGTRYAEAGRVRNVMARLAGRSPGRLGVLLMSHYDGVPGGPAAGDDAAGVATVLETLRALRAGPRLEHDVIALFTDGEEAGLLGAAAFVREHPWARAIGVALNFEARGTRGRSYMFETGPGNLDVARVLRTAGDVSATSLSVTVYRSLPNDTDLSELALLRPPALNFAFADGVERYHTAHDDVAHLDPGSVQHHGAQALALARAFGDGPLPRPRTGDAVFFDLPLVGLVVYPEAWAMPLGLLAALAAAVAGWRVSRRERRWKRDAALGAIAVLAAVALGGGAAHLAGQAIAGLHDRNDWGGAPAFRGVYVAAIALLALSLAAASWAAARRWASAAGAHVGALVVWTVLSLAVAARLPGVSFAFTWPLLASAIAAAVPSDANERAGAAHPGRLLTLWVATVVAAAVIVPIIFAVGAVLLGIVGPGGTVVGVLVPLLALLLAPQLELLGGARRWSPAIASLASALVLFATGAATVRRSTTQPGSSYLVYTLDADGDGAWLATPAALAEPGSWGGAALGGDARTISTADPTRTDPTRTDPTRAGSPPRWVAGVLGRSIRMSAAPAPRIELGAPNATLVADSGAADRRRLVLRIAAPPGTLTVGLRAVSTRVLDASVDGRSVDPSRYRWSSGGWRLGYSAPPDSGFVLALETPVSTPVTLELTAMTAGIPPLPGVTVPPRPADIVSAQTGDVTVVRRVLQF